MNNRLKKIIIIALLAVILIVTGFFSRKNRHAVYRWFNPLVGVNVSAAVWDESAGAFRLDNFNAPSPLLFSWPMANEKMLLQRGSRLVLYENGKRLRTRSHFEEFSEQKRAGRYSLSINSMTGAYETKKGKTSFSLFFNTSDDSDPRENGRKYTAACPWVWAAGNRAFASYCFLFAGLLILYLLYCIPASRRWLKTILSTLCSVFSRLTRIDNSYRRVFLAAAILYPLILSVIVGLANGEFVSRTEDMVLLRTTDFQSPVLHTMNGTLETLPEIYAKIARAALLFFPAILLRTLLDLGMDFYLAHAAIVAVMRALAVWAWLPWFVWLKVPRWFVFLFAPLLLSGHLVWGQIYRYVPMMVFCGEITISLFLLAAGLALLGGFRAAFVFWLLQAWTHPSTFASWSLLFIALILLARGVFDDNGELGGRRSRRLAGAVCVALVVLPVIGAWTAGLFEAWGIIRVDGGRHYWDFVVSRNIHSLFGGVVDKANYPGAYLLLVAGLFLLSLRLTPLGRRLRMVNRFFACTGLAYYIIYISLVETRFSILANILLPLRFETLYLPLYVLNLFALFFQDGDMREQLHQPQWTRFALNLVAVMFSLHIFTSGDYYSNLLYLFPLLAHIILSVGLLASRNMPRADKMRAIAPSFALVVFASFVTIAMLHVQTLSPDMFHKHLREVFVMPWHIVQGLGLCAIGTVVLAAADKLGGGGRRAGFVCTSILLLLFLGNIALGDLRGINYGTAGREAALVMSGVRARTYDSQWNRFRQWHGGNVSRDDGILNHPDLLLLLIGIPSTSINADILAFSLYVPDMADSLADDLNEIFDIDIGELAARGEVLDFDWNHVKDKYLASGGPSLAGTRRYRWLVEPSAIEPREKDSDRIAYENKVVRVYEIPRPKE